MTADNDFVCGFCGKIHTGLPTDFGFRLPDEIWAIPTDERDRVAKTSPDICRYDGRLFIRCVIEIPFTERPGDFAWGVWVEVLPDVLERYFATDQAGAAGEPRHPGQLANRLQFHDAVLGIPVWVQFQDTLRPLVHLLDESDTILACDQRGGIDDGRYHALLEVIGVTV